jgi:hypothetical protein
METLLGRGQDLNISALCNPKLRARVAIAQHDSADAIGQDLNISALCNPKLRARVAIAQHDSADAITADRMNRFLAHGHGIVKLRELFVLFQCSLAKQKYQKC